ncbi:hypothetical protein OE88DRAFT_1664590 [Heliocybe sulcata]|uniref:Uncharacterized protein n=1 Tax=Heliocybe sulcata TaxID=5364 RepID=A0A5C3MWP3_9AGAM|nr:hypothetical protein OE88DRAFT_1664590 [Heliocybe sulcata]
MFLCRRHALYLPRPFASAVSLYPEPIATFIPPCGSVRPRVGPARLHKFAESFLPAPVPVPIQQVTADAK